MAALRIIPLLIIIASSIIWSANAAPKQDIGDIVTNAYLGAIGDPEEKEIIDELIKKNRGLQGHDIKQYLYVDPIISTETVIVHVRDNSPKYRGSVKVYFNELNLAKTDGDLRHLSNNNRKTKISDDVIIDAFITENKLPDLRKKVKLVPHPSKNAPKTQARLIWKKEDTYIVPGDMATKLIGFAVVTW